MIHDQGAFKGKPFIPVNCGAIPETLIESEMFGHKRGSFTGAVSEKLGLFEAAKDGTLFLDEVGELPLTMQVKLLRALQERTIRRVGGNDDIEVNARIIAATNRDLEAAVAQGTFREDLYYRLNVIMIKTPSLREREGDIKLLAEAFLKRYAAEGNKKLTGFEPAVMKILEKHPWPGNIRELENVVQRAVAMESGTKITVSSLPTALRGERTEASGTAVSAGWLPLTEPDFKKGKVDLEAILAQVETAYITRALQEAGGIKKKAADLLGITFRSLRYRLKALKMDK
jgi:two-component system response regulator PilR (NtrC family)